LCWVIASKDRHNERATNRKTATSKERQNAAYWKERYNERAT